VKVPSESARAALSEVFTPENEKLYQLLEANPGPPMEQTPFPRFEDNPKPNTTSLCFPSVLFIGVQKSGTSTIADWMFRGGILSPLVFDNEPDFYNKEVHFFDHDDRYNEGPKFYAQRFHHSCQDHAEESMVEKSLAMDATPNTYMYPDRVHEVFQSTGEDQIINLKIMVVLRDPVLRELSYYNHMAYMVQHLDYSKLQQWHKKVLKKNSTAIMSFDEYVEQVAVPTLKRKKRKTSHGMYATHLSKWFQEFDRQQILVLSFQELQHNPKKLQQRIQEFLGYPITAEMHLQNSLEKRESHPSEFARAKLSEVFAPENDKLYQLLREHPGPSMEQTPFPRFEDNL